MENIKTIVVEDEPLAREGLKAYIREIGFLELVATCENALEANTALHTFQPSLMFLDIQMPKITGIDFLKSLAQPPLVIFTTAYPNYALQGFDLDVVDYLVKPYPFDRFLKATNKARDILQQKKQLSGLHTDILDHVYVKADSRFERINFEDILYVEGMENYVSIHTRQGRLITMMTMKSMEELLPLRRFLRVHKTYIVALEKVTAVDGNQVCIGDKKLPISRQRRNEILDQILKK